jgi:hypothetical protein
MLITSWLITLTAKGARSALASLATGPGREIRTKSGSHRLVLMTETQQPLSEVRRDLLQIPGVDTAEPIASFDDEDPSLALLRWNTASSADVARSAGAAATSAAAPGAALHLPPGTSIAGSERPAVTPVNEAPSI